MIVRYPFIWASTRKNFRGVANNTGADQPAHPRSLTNAFVIHFLESIISRLAKSLDTNFKFLASLCSWGDWFEPRCFKKPEGGFCRVETHMLQDTDGACFLWDQLWWLICAIGRAWCSVTSVSVIQESQTNVRNGNENQYSRAMHETTEHKERMVMRNGNHSTSQLTLNAPIATKVVCFSRLLKCLRSLHGKQCGPRSDCSYGKQCGPRSGAVCSRSTLFASILNSSVMLY